MKFPDPWLFIPALLLTTIGLLITSTVSPAEFAFQWKVALFSITVSVLVTQIDSELLYITGKPLYILTVLLLLFLLLFVDPVRGSRRWIEFGPFTLQVSEFAKIAIILLFSNLFVVGKIKSYASFLLSVSIISIPVLLVFAQPDLGSSIILGATGILSLIALRPKLPYVLSLTALCIAAIPIVLSLLAPYQKARIEHFIHPSKDPLGASYNQIQAIIAVGSGQLIGKGLGKGTQSRLEFLPEKQTDFFFATAAEQLGFIGSVCIIALYALLAWRIVSISNTGSHSKAQVIYLGSMGILFIQPVIHIGINLGLLPVTGIPLPFLSVGGSSLMVSWLSIGMLASVEKDNRERMTYEIG